MEQKYTLPNGVVLYKWPHNFAPTEALMKAEMEKFGFKAYDLQTCPVGFDRSMHTHDYEEIRAAVQGVITFHFKEYPVTIEAGDIVIVPGGIPHEARIHNQDTFTAFKGSRSGVRCVTELGDGHGSVEDLQKKSL